MKTKTQDQVIEPVKLTKSALNKFIIWSTSRYNSYLDFGTKKQNVDLVYDSIRNGFYTDSNRTDPTKTIFTIECSAGSGESYNGKFTYWKLKGRSGDYKYEINCTDKTVKGIPSGNMILFNTQQK